MQREFDDELTAEQVYGWDQSAEDDIDGEFQRFSDEYSDDEGEVPYGEDWDTEFQTPEFDG